MVYSPTFCSFLAFMLAMGIAACGDDDSAGNNTNDLNNNNQGVCGDGNLDWGEVCDDGAGNSDSIADACRTDCREAYCGDGVADTGEECDDSNVSDNDGCVHGCLVNVCGDGFVDETLIGTEPTERCDDGNTDDGDDCRGDCLQDMTLCGNGTQDPEEECDDGGQNNDTLPDACRTSCKRASCGDGVTDTDEVCDDGAANSDTTPDACRTDCTVPYCGDGVVDVGQAEECDDASANSDTAPDACRVGCLAASCGDGVMDTGETCDDASANSDIVPDACRLDCRVSFCGDGVRDSAESCDGSDLGSDDCDNLTGESFTGGTLGCTVGCAHDTSLCTTCGDGAIEWNEVCDGMNFAGETCVTQGWQFGVLSCQNGCSQINTGDCHSYSLTSAPFGSISVNLNDVHGAGGSNRMVVGDGGLLLEFVNGAWATWDLSTFTSENLYGVFQQEHDLFGFVGAAGTARAHTDLMAGVWVDLSSSLPNAQFNDVAMVGGSVNADVYSVSSAGHVFMASSNGFTLDPVDITPTSTPPALYGVWAEDNSSVYVVGAGGTIMQYNGTTWQTHVSGVTDTLYGIYWTGSASGLVGVVVGGDGTDGVALSYDGTTWTSMILPAGTPDLRAVYGTGSSRIFAVGVGGTIVYYDGLAWTNISSGTTEDLNGVWGDAGSFYIVGDAGTMLDIQEQL